MKYSYPSTFSDYDSWVEYTEKLQRQRNENQPWLNYTPEEWLKIFPDLDIEMISRHYLDSECQLSQLNEEYNKKLDSFSQALSTRIFQESLLDLEIGKKIAGVEKQISFYKRMLVAMNPKKTKSLITDQDIEVARNYPILELLTEAPKRGFISCPFHSEKTASCKVYADHLYCFGCGKSINSIGYLMEIHGKTFIDSIKYLCQK